MATEKYPYSIRFNFQITERNVEQDPELEEVIEFLDRLPKKSGRYSPTKNYVLELIKRDLKERYSPEAREFFESREKPNLSQTIASILTSLNDEKREEVASTLENLSDSRSMNDPGVILDILKSAQLDNSTESYDTAAQSAEEPVMPAASESPDTAESSRPDDRADLSADIPVPESQTTGKAAAAITEVETAASQIKTAPSVKTRKEEKKTPTAAPKKSASGPAWARVNRSAGLSGEGNVK